MPRKKSVKSKSGKSVPKKVRNSSIRKVVASQRKIKIVTSNLILFVILFVVSLGLYYVSTGEFFMNLFWMISLLTGLLAVTFLIIYLIFWFLKLMKK